MSDAPPPANQFWLLTGAVPAGPFTTAQVHAELAAGRATWQTPACPVGGRTWLPLLKTPGIGPGAGCPPAVEPTRSAEPAAAPAPTLPAASGPPSIPIGVPVAFTPSASVPAASTPAARPESPPGGRDKVAERVGMAIGVGILTVLLAAVGAAVYGVYEWVRPLTATEVCKKMDAAKTAAEAKKYATPRMHPLIDFMFADKSAIDPNDAFDWTNEVDGPRPNTKLLGFRGTTFLPEAGRRVQMAGHIVLVKSDGWKVDDFVVTGVEGAALPGPVSLVDEYRRPPGSPAGGFARTTPAPGPRLPAAPTGTTRVKSRYEQIFEGVKDTIGWGGIVIVIVVVVVVLSAREAARQKARSD